MLYDVLVQSPHVKSNVLSGSMKSVWRAMVSPAFDFQGDPAQQGGTFILGPGKALCLKTKQHFLWFCFYQMLSLSLLHLLGCLRKDDLVTNAAAAEITLKSPFVVAPFKM